MCLPSSLKSKICTFEAHSMPHFKLQLLFFSPSYSTRVSLKSILINFACFFFNFIRTVMNCVLCSKNHIFCCLLNIMLKGMMTRIAFLLQLQWTMLLCIFEHVFQYALASFWRAYIHTEVNLLGQRIYIFPILLNNTRLFKQKIVVWVYSFPYIC